MVVECDFQPAPHVDDFAISVSASGELFHGETHFLGRFDEHGAQIVRALHDDCTLKLQVVLSSKSFNSQKARKGMLCTGPCVVSASIIIYGPMDAHESVGSFFQECELYLQDPIGCDRNVPYRNPHRLAFASDPTRMTFDLCPTQMHMNVTTISSHSILDTMLSSEYLAEYDTPSLLRTSLLPYVSIPSS